MARHNLISSHFTILLIFIVVIALFSHTGNQNLCISNSPSNLMQSLDMTIFPKLSTDRDSIRKYSKDYGNLRQEIPSAVLYPSSIGDIKTLIKLANNLSTPFTVAPRGSGHSVRGQASARGGVVVDMKSLSKNENNRIRVSWNPESPGFHADVGGEQRWIDVLLATLEYGLAPVSWTDYLYLTVGGTLSNGGISGQSFLHGPQISNVLEMDVITGKGELLTCSKHINFELFYAVLGGLGQFGVITRARIVLEKAPSRAKWLRLIYSDFTKFTQDQEHLISVSNGPHYVEGSLITNHSPVNDWRSSFYSPSNQSKICSLLKKTQGPLYSLELVIYYDDNTGDTIDQELETLLKELNHIPGFIFAKDVRFFDFLSRVGNRDTRKNEEQSEAHPWLNLFVPKSNVSEFNTGVLLNIIHRSNHMISGPVLFYPLSRKKWDDRMSVVIPDEGIFYTLGLLHTSYKSNESEIFDRLNDEIMDFCEKGGIKVKQYLPHYKSREDWTNHFGRKWKVFEEMKMKFDPKMILSPGQRIFNFVR